MQIIIDPVKSTQSLRVLPGQKTCPADDYELFLEGILEAPRGSREGFQGKQYVPAYKTDACRVQSRTTQSMGDKPQQVQMDVVVAVVRSGAARKFAFPLLQGAKQGDRRGNSQPQLLPGILDSPRDAQLFKGFLQALKEVGVITFLAEPKLVACSGQQASFLSGGERAVPVPTGLGSVGVQFEEFGSRINCGPTVLGNGTIRLKLESEVSDLNSSFGTSITGGSVIPGPTTQRIRTTIELKPGQTFVLAGLAQRVETSNGNAMPVLDMLPVAGPILNKLFSQEQREIIILVTPHLVGPETTPQGN